MSASTPKSRLSAILLAVAALALATCACGFYIPAPRVSIPEISIPEEITQVVDIRISEDMLQDSSPSFYVGDHKFYAPFSFYVDGHNFYTSLLDSVNRVELYDGYLRFVGFRLQSDGSWVHGTVDLYLGAEDDRLVARVIAVDIPGITIEDPVVVEINREIKMEFDRAMFSSDADVLFKEVQVTDEELHLKIQVTVRF